eukprot:174103_1
MSEWTITTFRAFILFAIIGTLVYIIIGYDTNPNWLIYKWAIEHNVTNKHHKPIYKWTNKVKQYLNFTDNTQNITTHNSHCGRIWLYQNKGLILSIYSITNNTVHIKNISPYKQTCNASRITIYVTIQGIEFLGGIAIPHTIKCEWHYSFKISIPGMYKIMVRLLYYDGILDAHYSKCNTSVNRILFNNKTTTINSNGIYHDNIHILKQIDDRNKFYAPQEQCCEWCTRLQNCAYYISQNTQEMKLNRCIMFDKSVLNDMQLVNTENVKNIKQQWIFGYNRKEITKYYLGCLAPTTPTQRTNCHKKQYDQIHNSNQFMTLKRNVFISAVQVENKPVCNYDNIKQFEGRWIKLKNNSQIIWWPRSCGVESLYCTAPVFFQSYHCKWRYNNSLQILKGLYDIYGVKNVWFLGDSIIGNMMKFM